jgi:hypothetical protein
LHEIQQRLDWSVAVATQTHDAWIDASNLSVNAL